MTDFLASNFSALQDESAFAVLARASELAAQGKHIVNLGIGQPDMKTPPHIVEAAIKALKDGHHGYTDALGMLSLRKAVCSDLHRRYEVDVQPGRILIVPGGKVTMYFAISIFGAPGNEILYPDPGFPIYRSMIAFTGAKARPIKMDEKLKFGFSADQVLEQINENTRLIILNSPGNPTGGVIDHEELEKLVEGLREWPKVYILSDEIYAQITYDGFQHRSLLSFEEIADRVILLDGWSKTYAMTGWRLGFGVWPEKLMNTVRKLASNSYSCVNTPAQFGAIAALEGSQDCIKHMTAKFDARRKLMVNGLNAIDGVSSIFPQGAFYTFANITKTELSSKELASRLLEDAGIACLAGSDFGENGEGYIRFSCAASDDDIEEALTRFGKLLREIA